MMELLVGLTARLRTDIAVTRRDRQVFANRLHSEIRQVRSENQATLWASAPIATSDTNDTNDTNDLLLKAQPSPSEGSDSATAGVSRAREVLKAWNMLSVAREGQTTWNPMPGTPIP